MKAFALMILALVSFVSFGAMAASSDCSQSWEKIASGRLDADFPKVQFGTTFVSIDGVCVKGNSLYTIAKVETCDKYSTGEASDCLRPVMTRLSTPIAFKREIPVNDVEFKTIDEKHALTYSIPVGYNGETFRQVCAKSFTIPACK